jgi:hypothetical protein
MRIIGYILLVLGFLWLAIWCAGSAAAVARSVGIENFKKYPAAQTYSGEQVCDAMRSVLDECAENAHGVLLPASLMFVGGVFLDIASKRSAKRKSPNTALEPTATAP